MYPKVSDGNRPIWQVRRNHREHTPPSLEAILLSKVSTVSLELYLGVGEIAPDALNGWLLGRGLVDLTMDCDGDVWMDVCLQILHPFPPPRQPVPHKYPKIP